jgi:hypothetical protein
MDETPDEASGPDLDRFYEIEVNGVSLVDWVDALIAGEPLADVHCDDCPPNPRS